MEGAPDVPRWQFSGLQVMDSKHADKRFLTTSLTPSSFSHRGHSQVLASCATTGYVRKLRCLIFLLLIPRHRWDDVLAHEQAPEVEVV